MTHARVNRVRRNAYNPLREDVEIHCGCRVCCVRHFFWWLNQTRATR